MKKIENKSKTVWQVEPIYMPMVKAILTTPFQLGVTLLSVLTFNKNKIKHNVEQTLGIVKGIIKLQTNDGSGQALLSDLYAKGHKKEFWIYTSLSVLIIVISWFVMFYTELPIVIKIMFGIMQILITTSEVYTTQFVNELFGREVIVRMIEVRDVISNKQIGNRNSLNVLPTSILIEWNLFMISIIKFKPKHAFKHFTKMVRKFLFIDKKTRTSDYVAGRADKIMTNKMILFTWNVIVLMLFSTKLLLILSIPQAIVSLIVSVVLFVYAIIPSYTIIELNKLYKGSSYV